jgi:hypothetical protein
MEKAMKNIPRLLAVTSWIILCSITPLAAFDQKTGKDFPNEKCERKETNGSSTYGQCTSVCKDLDVSTTKDVNSGYRTCKAKARAGKNWTLVSATGNSSLAFWRFEPGGEVQACSTTSSAAEIECHPVKIVVADKRESK